MAPSTARQWNVVGKDGFDSLKFNEKAEVPQLGDKDVLVKSKSTLFFPYAYSTLLTSMHSPRRIIELP